MVALGFLYVSNENNPGCLGYVRDHITQLYRNHFINQYKDPYSPTRIQSHRIHGTGIFTSMKTKKINHSWIGKYTMFMDPMATWKVGVFFLWWLMIVIFFAWQDGLKN